MNDVNLSGATPAADSVVDMVSGSVGLEQINDLTSSGSDIYVTPASGSDVNLNSGSNLYVTSGANYNVYQNYSTTNSVDLSSINSGVAAINDNLTLIQKSFDDGSFLIFSILLFVILIFVTTIFYRFRWKGRF